MASSSVMINMFGEWELFFYVKCGCEDLDDGDSLYRVLSSLTHYPVPGDFWRSLQDDKVARRLQARDAT